MNNNVNGGKHILDLECANPELSFSIDGREFYKTKYNNLYISKDGYVFKHLSRDSSVKYPIKGKLDTYGYPYVSISASQKLLVHQIMMQTFYKKPADGLVYCVDHINRNRTDNRLENLRYVSPNYNASIGRRDVKPAIATKITASYKGIEKHFESFEDFSKFYGISYALWQRWYEHSIPKFKRGYALIECNLLKETEYNKEYYVKFDDFEYRLIIDDNEYYSFKDIKSLMKFLNCPPEFYQRYVMKHKMPRNHKLEFVNIKEGLTTIEIVLKTKVE